MHSLIDPTGGLPPQVSGVGARLLNGPAWATVIAHKIVGNPIRMG
jgi:hypothetical protein